MNEIMNISGIECFEKDGTAYLKLETIAWGLGFTKTEVKNEKEYTSVRWERVFGFLKEIDFDHKWAKDDFIPENIFYRLAMKAKNEAAERFQAKIADDVIPSIRKHGAYMTENIIDKMISSPEFGIKLLTELKEEKERRKAVEEQNSKLALENEEMKPKAEFYDDVTGSSDTIEIGEVAKVLNCGIGRNKLFDFLRKEKVLMKNNIPKQHFVDEGYFRVIETKYTKPNGDVSINLKTVVYQKGVDYIRKLLIKKRKVEQPQSNTDTAE